MVPLTVEKPSLSVKLIKMIRYSHAQAGLTETVFTKYTHRGLSTKVTLDPVKLTGKTNYLILNDPL